MLKKFKTLPLAIRHFFIKEIAYTPKEIQQADQTYQIRTMAVEDIKELLDIERAVYFGELPWTQSIFKSEIYSSIPHLYLSLIHQDRVVGFIGSRILGSDAHITNIAILPAYQGLGLGTSLIDEVQKFAIMSRCETMSLEVRVSNTDAQRLYRKLGFVSRSIKREYYTENAEDALDMIKTLTEI